MNYFSLAELGFIVGLSGAMLPGPMSAYAISIVLKSKMTNVFLMVLGHIFIEAVMVILLLLGLKQIIGSKIMLNILTIAGGGGLVLMGLYFFKSRPSKNIFV
jgi:threonine/homoserine/homoserine lactone efflux protein